MIPSCCAIWSCRVRSCGLWKRRGRHGVRENPCEPPRGEPGGSATSENSRSMLRGGPRHAARPLLNLADLEGGKSLLLADLGDGVGVVGADDEHQTDSHIEHTLHFVGVNVPRRL